MNYHPSNLHAAANCWSLRRSWSAIRDANSAPDDGDVLRSPIWGARTGSGGHGDPIGGTVTARVDRSSGCDETTQTIRDNVDQARWLATSALRQQGMPVGPALAALAHVIGDLDPATAAEVARYLDHADQAARRTLRLGNDHWPIPSNPPCPSCGTRLLRARRSNPDSSAWPVICAAGCRCAGNACRCGMPIKARGVDHIWPAAWARDTLDLPGTDLEASTV